MRTRARRKRGRRPQEAQRPETAVYAAAAARCFCSDAAVALSRSTISF